MRDRLIKLLQDNSYLDVLTEEHWLLAAEQLLAEGVIVPPYKPICVMCGEHEFDTDVYCPHCGTDLSGLYGEEPTSIIQCYICGNYVSNTHIITREEAEKAIAERENDGT